MASLISAGTTSATALNMSADTSGVLQLASNNGTVAVTITTAQNLGIGTASPSAKLDVSGSIALSPVAQGKIRRTTVNGSYGVGIQGNTADTIDDTNPGATVIVAGGPITTDAYAGRIDLIAYGNLTDVTSNVITFQRRTGVNTTAESARVTNLGNFAIGETSGSARLSVLTTNASQYAGYFNFVSSGYGIGVRCSNGGTANLMYFFSPNYVGEISTNGTNTTYGTGSDYRLKENIEPMQNALEKVALLKPVTYKWKANGLDGQGFIAHELQSVVPECVTGKKDETRIENYEISPAVQAAFDEEGNVLTPAIESIMGEREVPKYQSVDTSYLVATLTAAIQELNAKVTALENK
jgi:hypothetical protein